MIITIICLGSTRISKVCLPPPIDFGRLSTLLLPRILDTNLLGTLLKEYIHIGKNGLFMQYPRPLLENSTVQSNRLKGKYTLHCKSLIVEVRCHTCLKYVVIKNSFKRCSIKKSLYPQKGGGKNEITETESTPNLPLQKASFVDFDATEVKEEIETEETWMTDDNDINEKSVPFSITRDYSSAIECVKHEFNIQPESPNNQKESSTSAPVRATQGTSWSKLDCLFEDLLIPQRQQRNPVQRKRDRSLDLAGKRRFPCPLCPGRDDFASKEALVCKCDICD